MHPSKLGVIDLSDAFRNNRSQSSRRTEDPHRPPISSTMQASLVLASRLVAKFIQTSLFWMMFWVIICVQNPHAEPGNAGRKSGSGLSLVRVNLFPAEAESCTGGHGLTPAKLTG